MEIKPIKRVVVEFADGTIQEWQLPSVSQGFYRERYTWNVRQPGEAGYDKWGQRLHIFELNWSLSEQEEKLTLEQPKPSLTVVSTGSTEQAPSGNGKEQAS